jgi:hypothetical protein
MLLVELAHTSDAGSCWDHDRAERLLRHQSTPEELRELGVDAEMITSLFPESP